MKFEDGSRGDSTRQFSRVSLTEEEDEHPHEAMFRPSVAKKNRLKTIIDTNIGHEHMDDVPTEEGATFHSAITRLLESMPFQVIMASCILLNAAVIGGETDFPELELWKVIETAFLVVFSLELLLRMCSMGCRGFFAPGDDQLWNLFDFVIVGLGIFDVLSQKLGVQTQQADNQDSDSKHHGGGVTTLFRMLRLLRILRIFKIVRFLKQLYLIFFGFVEAIQAICLVTLLMVFLLYICSIIMVRTYGRLPAVIGEDRASEVLATQFGSIKASMLSLFELMSNPGNLAIYHVLFSGYPMLTLFLLAFVIFGSFGMIALLTGVISESMFEKNQTRAQEERLEREHKRELLKQTCIELFASVEKDEDEEATPSDLEDLLPFVREMFEKLEIEYMQHDFDHIISRCDTDDNGAISETEFVSGILSLCDGVRAASIQEVYFLVSQMSAKFGKMEGLQDEIKKLTSKAIPDLKEEVRRMMEKIETQPQVRPPSTRFSTSMINTGFHAQQSEVQLGDMKASLASTLDQHTDLLSKKIDDLKANVKELCKGPPPPKPLNGHCFTVGDEETEKKNGSRAGSRAGSPVLPDLWSGNADKNAKSGTSERSSLSDRHDSGQGDKDRQSSVRFADSQCITPLSPPPAANGTNHGCLHQHHSPGHGVFAGAGGGQQVSAMGVQQNSRT